ncbi:hypothetical protein Z517_06470 [Fonsecaea pedrosoi CBS 271.37]|uniref:J domain-containing protein n=1 Tax=Fonsecaea pedrosoi CBS 271.37 TaxID=1442368 RepID=A0A0D2GMT5_9EURO|nr:uncharacterized protein Z517_06470 [Fonsecaea pedrosoi CBS 271.37]KIW79855.1 hypothetical protein Z517_06470 [Fonsecaea pedrosoi CBS 271.37]
MASSESGGQEGQPSSSYDIVPHSRNIYPPDTSDSSPPQGSSPNLQDKGGQPLVNGAQGEGGQGSGKTGDHGEAKAKASGKHTRRQKATIERIMKCEEKNYYGILDVPSSAPQDEIREAFRKLSFLTHPDKTGFRHAKDAFQRVSNAYQVLESIANRRRYDREGMTYKPNVEDAEGFFNDVSASFADNAYDADPDDSLDSTDDDISDEDEGGSDEPDDLTLAIYKQATPFVNQFLRGMPADLDKLKELNGQLLTRNKKENVRDLKFYINTNVLEAMAQELANAFGTLDKEPTNEKGVETLANLDEQLEKLKRSFRYPEDWKIEHPAGIKEKVEQELRKRSKGKGRADPAPESTPNNNAQAGSSTNQGQERRAPAPESTSNNDAQAGSSTDPGQGRADQSMTDIDGQAGNLSGHPITVSPATSAEVGRVRSKVLQIWAEQKHDIHITDDGDAILCYKALSKEGKDPYAYEFVVMTPGTPHFQVKTGAEIGRRNVKAYLELRNKYQIYTDKGDDNTPKYTWRQKDNFQDLLFVASKPRKSSTAGKTPKAADTQCCVLWKDPQKAQGARFAVMARNHFKSVADDDERKLIEKYCRSMGVLAPWEMNPKTVQLSADTPLGQQLLSAGRSGSLLSAQSLVNSNALALPLNGGNAVAQDVMTTLQSSIASLQTHVQRMESRFESTMMSMNEAILKQQEQQTKMQERMDCERVEQTSINKELLVLLRNLTLGSPNSSSENST